MPKNKNKPNAFYFFMLDWKTQEEKKGRRFPNGLRDVQNDPKCNQEWSSLSAVRKASYKNREKENKNKMKEDKKNCFGDSMKELERLEMKNQQFIDNMKKYISSTVRDAKKNNCVQELKFYVIHVNYFYSKVVDNNKIEYCPAEIGLAEFSLEEGVTRTYEKIVNAKIQIGYSFEAANHSRNTHQIPKEPNFGESDYNVIYNEICEFLEPGRKNGKLPPLFTQFEKERIRYPVLSLLDNFDNNDDTLTIYSFEELFVSLNNIIFEENEEIMKFDTVIAVTKLKNDQFDFKKSIQCDYHSVITGGNYCSKSHVQRWIFELCCEICPYMGIHLAPGFHIPIENVVIKNEISLHKKLEKLNLGGIRMMDPAIKTNVKSNELKSSSERNYADEARRKAESLENPLKIVDHSANRDTSSQNVSTPWGNSVSSSNDSGSINLDEDNFPSIGRGAILKTKGQGNRKPKTNYASRLK